MLYNIAGSIFIILAICGGVHTLNNKNHMPFALFGVQKEEYDVRDREKFNRIMVTRNIFMIIWLLLTGVLCMISKETVSLTYPTFTIFIHMIFSAKAKKYIKRK